MMAVISGKNGRVNDGSSDIAEITSFASVLLKARGRKSPGTHDVVDVSALGMKIVKLSLKCCGQDPDS